MKTVKFIQRWEAEDSLGPRKNLVRGKCSANQEFKMEKERRDHPYTRYRYGL
jgi:hypothetical protein